MTQPPFFQCCCNCIYLKPVFFHCTTEPKPTVYDIARHGGSRCVCGIQKGWACCSPESDRIHDNWGPHSCGCELYTAKDALDDTAAQELPPQEKTRLNSEYDKQN